MVNKAFAPADADPEATDGERAITDRQSPASADD
jgi:hypothetical protein